MAGERTRAQDVRQRSRSRASGIVAPVALAALLAGCAAPPAPPAPPAQPPAAAPRSYVVLMEDLDGKVGSVVVRSGQASVVLERRLQAVGLLPDSPPRRFEPSAGQIQHDFAAAIGARALPAEVFRLYFPTSAARLSPESERLVGEILEAVRRRPAPDVSIIGHTDTVGDGASNERLGLQRARWVEGMLRQRGLQAVEVTVASHGEADPLVATPDATDEPRNRRVEVIVR